ncbi:hypothetical protein DY000_02055642 [Brassica cretica]|uniref:Uncharacterized protein n=1 Tax=Brassica cretica TaxID=69181 RepID=A0ABQ7AE76_BRACR|nr:hypothetical protein DY000_02055642 [Brassica cretica]
MGVVLQTVESGHRLSVCRTWFKNMISVKGVNFSLLIELLSHFHLPQTYLVQQATLFTKEFIIQSYMRLKWPCRSGCTPKAVRFYPSTSATSILFVARIKKMAPKKKVL